MDFMAEDQNSHSYCHMLVNQPSHQHFTILIIQDHQGLTRITGDYYHNALFQNLFHKPFLYSQRKTNVNPNHQIAAIWFNHTV
jgi:hypothetical protein